MNQIKAAVMYEYNQPVVVEEMLLGEPKTGEVLKEEHLSWNSDEIPSGSFTRAEEKLLFKDVFALRKAGAGFGCRNVKLLKPKIRYKYLED